MSRAVLVPLLLGIGCAYAPTVLEQLAEIEQHVESARAAETRACAPVPLAHAEADLAFARLEITQGDLLRASQHLSDARDHAAEATALGAACRPPPEAEAPDAPPDDDPDGTLDDTGAIADVVVPETPVDGAPPAEPTWDLAPATPPSDRDGDGIADDLDACPDVPETPNDYLDDDGCPDVAPERVRLTADRILLEDRLRFAPGAATLLPDNDAILDEVRRVLEESPELHVRIEGHTDSAGEEEENLSLSQRRADAVRTWLIASGIAGTRLIAEGFGETRPIDTNRTPTGRLNNRRIELHLIAP